MKHASLIPLGTCCLLLGLASLGCEGTVQSQDSRASSTTKSTSGGDGTSSTSSPNTSQTSGPSGTTGSGTGGGTTSNPTTGPAPVSAPSPWMARRLTRAQYAFTLKDLLGVDLSEEELQPLPFETRTEGFENNVLGLVTTTNHVEAFLGLAETIAQEKIDWSKHLDKHATCQDLAKPSCEESYIKSVGETLWRRPVKADEVTRMKKLFQVARDEDITFEDAASLTLQSMLSSPQFLYHLEDESEQKDGVRTLSGHEIASRLAYLLWQSAPDETLLQAAKDDKLKTSAQIVAQAKRMLANQDLSKRATQRFVRDWFALDRLRTTTRSNLSEPEARDLLQSAVATYQAHVWEDRKRVLDIFETETLSITKRVADRYDFETDKNGMSRVDVSGKPERVGILTHPGVLAAMSDRDAGGLVSRGLFMMEDLECRFPQEPPPNLNLDEFKDHLPEGATEREYSIDREERGQCAGCHAQFDPLAYAFERFDGLGVYSLKNKAGRDLREDGELISPDGTKVMFSSVGEFVTYFASEPLVERCVVKKHIEFALGHHLEDRTFRGAVEKIRRAWVDQGGTYEALVLAIVADEIFQTSMVESR